MVYEWIEVDDKLGKSERAYKQSPKKVDGDGFSQSLTAVVNKKGERWRLEFWHYYSVQATAYFDSANEAKQFAERELDHAVWSKRHDWKLQSKETE